MSLDRHRPKNYRRAWDGGVKPDLDAVMVTVCSECLRASCWQGKFYCDAYKSAGIVEMSVRDLIKLRLEHPSHLVPDPVELWEKVIAT